MTAPLEGVIDSHCHVAVSARGKQPEDTADAILTRARAAGVRGFVVVGVGETTLEANNAVALAESNLDVVAAVGVHPHDAKTCNDAMVQELRALASRERVAAVGEIGLDYHYDLSPRDVQRSVFREFVRMARELKKPIVIHTRSAGQEVLDILEQENARDVGGVIHCFSEDVAFARRALDLAFDISFSGIVTFKTATAIQEAARFVPRDRYLVETDAPYLAPVPLRGKTCEPAYVVYTARFLAGLRNVAPEQIAQESADNARRRFHGLSQ
jgi:TatD DNase family protein